MNRRVGSIVVLVTLTVAACGGSGSTSTSTSTRRPRASSTSTTSTSTSSSSSTSSGPASTSTTRVNPPVGRPPGPVTVVSAGPGGGSGEIQVSWAGVADATTYRVERATTAAGPFATTATVSAATGSGPHDASVVNLYRSGADFFYVDVPADAAPNRSRFYRVTASNASGAAAPSAVVCGAPAGSACA